MAAIVQDEVFGTAPRAFAEHAVRRADKLALKPANLSFERAAAVPSSALSALSSQSTGRPERRGWHLADPGQQEL